MCIYSQHAMELTGPSRPHEPGPVVGDVFILSGLIDFTPSCAFCASQICLKGKVHIFKYLNIQACRTDKKPDTLDLPSLGKRCLPQPLTDRYGHGGVGITSVPLCSFIVLLFCVLPGYLITTFVLCYFQHGRFLSREEPRARLWNWK